MKHIFYILFIIFTAVFGFLFYYKCNCVPKYDTIINSLSFAGTIITILGLAGMYYSLKSSIEGKQTLDEMNSSLITRFMNDSNYLNEVIDLITRAKNSIHILQPDLAEGIIGQNKQFVDYICSLNQTTKYTTPTIIKTYDRPRLYDYRMVKIKHPNEYTREQIEPITDLAKSSNLDFKIFDKSDIIDCIDKCWVDSTELFKNRYITIKHSNYPIIAKIWIIDDNEAIYVILNDANDTEIPFHTKDKLLISNLKNFIVKEDPISNGVIRSLKSAVYFNKKVIKESAISFLNSTLSSQFSNQKFLIEHRALMLGTIGILGDKHDYNSLDDYLKATVDFFHENHEYKRIANFIPSNENEYFEIRKNLAFFALHLSGYERDKHYLYHNPNLARGLNDFHFRINNDKVVIRLGSQISDNDTAIEISDNGVKKNFEEFYNNLLCEIETIPLTFHDISLLAAELENKHYLEGMAFLEKYLLHLKLKRNYAPSNKISFDVNFKPEVIDIDSDNLTSTTIKKIEEQFNSHGFFILNTLSVLGNDEARVSDFLYDLSKHFGRIIHHDRSQSNGIVKLSVLSGFENYKGTSNGEYPPHTDGIYDSEPPRIVALYCLKQANGESGGENFLISGKLLCEKLVSSESSLEIINKLLSQDYYIKRGHKSKIVTILENICSSYQIRFRNDDVSKLIAIDNEEAEAILDQLTNITDDPNNKFEIRLQEGQILFFDNTSLLHGRGSFSDTSRVFLRISYEGISTNNNICLHFGFKLPN